MRNMVMVIIMMKMLTAMNNALIYFYELFFFRLDVLRVPPLLDLYVKKTGIFGFSGNFTERGLFK